MKTNPSVQNDYSSRRKRRAAVAQMAGQLELIAAAEEAYRDNIPLNLLGSQLYDSAEEYICLLDEAVEMLRSIY
jgi:hypothetical protein